jgi:hypothetical protein
VSWKALKEKGKTLLCFLEENLMQLCYCDLALEFNHWGFL